MKIGIFGGAFDPPHLAHIALARAAIEQAKLDFLLILPTGKPPHRAATTTRAEDRLAMCQLAFQPLVATGARVSIDERELYAPAPSYTVESLRSIGAEHPQAALFLLLGEDQWRRFVQWSRWQELLAHGQLAQLLVAKRNEENKRIGVDWPVLSAAEQAALVAKTRWLDMDFGLYGDISSSKVRTHTHAAAGEAQEVSEAVARYIAARALYC